MDLIAYCTYDYETIKTLSRTMLFGKTPFRNMWLRYLVAGLLLILTVASMLFFCVEVDRVFLALLSLALSLVLLPPLFCVLFLPRIKFRTLGERQGMRTRLRFCDSCVKVANDRDNFQTEADLPYLLIINAYETSRYIFLFINTVNAFIVDKTTVDAATAAAIRHKLSVVLTDGYTVCK